MKYYLKLLQSFPVFTSMVMCFFISLTNGKRQISLIVCFVIFVNTAFADLIVEERRPQQPIKFTNISSLSIYKLHILNRSYYEDFNLVITRDTTYFPPSRRGSSVNWVVFFALLGNTSTDTIGLDLREGNNEIYFTGIKNDKLQFIKKKLKVDKGFTGAFTNTDKEGFNDTESGFWKTDKLLYGLSITALLGLMMYFIFFKRDNNRPYNNPIV